MAKSEAFLKFLDHAYALVEDQSDRTRRFESLISEAETALSDFRPGVDEMTTKDRMLTLEAHLSRIDRMSKRQMDEPDTLPEACIFLRGSRGKVLLNKEAAMLLGDGNFTEQQDLPFQEASLGRLTARLAYAAQSKSPVVLHRSDLSCSYLAHVEKIDAMTHRVAIDNIDWRAVIAAIPLQVALSAAEQELLNLFIQGASQPEAARALNKSPETVKSQAKSILRKSDAKRIQDVVQLAEDLVVSRTFRLSDHSSTASDVFETCRLADGRIVGFARYGAVGGVPLLLLHGLIQGPFFSDRMAQMLGRAGFDLIAPSRPGFGETDIANPRDTYDSKTVSDAVDLLDRLGIENVIVLAHQGGVSHACRVAQALGPRCKYVLMLGAGIPIDDKRHLKGMNRQTRVGAIGARYTPRLLETMLRIGMKAWGHNYDGYLRNYFGRNSEDVQRLKDPEIGPLQIAGVRHMSRAGPEAVLDDGRAAMSNWLDDYLAVPCPCGWVHSKTDPIMNCSYVLEFLDRNPGTVLRLFEDGGNCMLYVYFSEIINILHQIHRDHPTG